MPAGPAVDLAKVGAPTRKGPPASFMPAPREVLAPQLMDSCAAAALPGQGIPMTYGQMPEIYLQVILIGDLPSKTSLNLSYLAAQIQRSPLRSFA